MDSIDILIYGIIGEDLNAQMIIDRLEQNKDVKKLNVRIASPGGDIYEAIAIMNAIARHKAEKKIFIDGLAASMASVIMCGVGGYIVAAKNSRIMIHNPWIEFTGGEASQLRKDADELDEFRKIMISVYKKRISGTDEEIIALMDKTTWYSADEAKAAGLVDEVREPSKMVAKFDRIKLSQVIKEFKGGTPHKKEMKRMPTLLAKMKAKYPGICPKSLARIIAEAQAAVYDNPKDCEAAGGTWDKTGNTCKDVPSDAQAAYDNPDDCEKNGGTWDEKNKKCTGAANAELEITNTPADCESAGKYWYNNTCNEIPEENIMVAEDAPQDEQACKDAGGTWDTDTEKCTIPAEEGGEGNTSDSSQPKQRKTVVTETFAMRKQKQEIAALRQSINVMNGRTADTVFKQVFGGVNISDEILTDIRKAMPYTHFISNGVLDTGRYEAALTKKRNVYKNAFSVSGMQGMTRKRNQQTENAEYAEEILRRNRKGGKK